MHRSRKHIQKAFCPSLIKKTAKKYNFSLKTANIVLSTEKPDKLQHIFPFKKKGGALKKALNVLLLTPLFCVLNTLSAQNITFHHLTTDDGLSQSSALALHKDKFGFIWIGTRDGLNCYNGNEIRTYKLEKSNPHSLFCNTVTQLEGDQHNTIYVLTTEGLAEYNLNTDQFTTLWKDVHITSMHYNQKLFVARGHEIYIHNTETSTFELYYQLPSSKLSITALYMGNNGDIFIGTSQDGVFLLNNKKEFSQPIAINSSIISIYQDSQGDVWIGSWEHGLFVISDGNVRNYVHDLLNSRSISSNFVRTCCEDDEGTIWVGTFNGLNKYNKQKKDFTLYKASNNPGGLTHSSIWCSLKDHQGTLWLGTYFGGVNYFNPEYEIYTRYRPSTHEKEGLSSPIIGRMTEDKDKNLWICTEGGGVNVYNKKTKTFKWYLPEEGTNSLSGENVKAIYYDEKKNLMWFGTHLGGLNKLDLRTDQFTHYKHDHPATITVFADIVRDIEPYREKLILATADGVFVFDPNTGQSQPLFKDSTNRKLLRDVYDICVDHQGTLWISVYGEGVFAYRFNTRKLAHYKHDPKNPNSLSNNNVNSITQDSRHNLYFCTSGRGLDVFRYERSDFENYDAKNNGLSSDCVYNVLEARPGELLVITNQGFSTFFFETKRFHNYNKQNGFPLSAINENALYLTQDGEIFLGGMQGMVSFRQQALSFTRKPYTITFTNLYVNGIQVKVNDETGLLTQPLSTTPSLTLKSSHSSIAFEFAASNYLPTNKDEIVYQLEGFSEEWTPTRDAKFVTYTNLNPGKYTLRIKNNNSNTNLVNEARLDIEVLPPIYKTPIAYLLYLVLISGLLYYLFRSYKQRIKLQASLEYEQRHLQDIENLNQSKLRFFTNISHEFRTPLTLILGQLEMLLTMQQFTPQLFHKVLKIYNNSLQMKELITELLDFRKQEEGLMRIAVSPHNIVDFLYANYLLFADHAETNQIHFTFSKSEDEILVWYDEKQMQKVLNNLLSNAFKCTRPRDSISIRVCKSETEVAIEVSDTGIGIAPKDIEHLFDNFYQVDRPELAETGTGIGLPLSKGIVELHHGEISLESIINEGSTFRFTLPLGNSHFSSEEISRGTEMEAILKNEKSELSPVLPEEEDELDSELPHQEVAHGTKMLIVEDNDSLRNMLAETFEVFYEVSTASDGEEGWEKVKAEMPHIVLSDIVMPKMTGTELCKSIKADIDTCHIPVVLLTAKGSIEHNIEGLKIGADDYIAKPFNLQLLISRCNNLVNSRIVLQEKFSRQPQTTPQMLATNALDKALLDKAATIVEQHMDNPELSVNELAVEMGMSRTKLFTKLKAIAGQTPNDFISLVRLKKAAFLLKNHPELSIVDISTMVGFSSPRYFSKCFKDMYHIRPLDYRKE